MRCSSTSFHDIPNTVAGRARLPGSGLDGQRPCLGRTAHAQAARAAVAAPVRPAAADRGDGAGPVWSADLAETGLDIEPAAQVDRLVALSRDCGLDGVVARRQEVAQLQALVRPSGW